MTTQNIKNEDRKTVELAIQIPNSDRAILVNVSWDMQRKSWTDGYFPVVDSENFEYRLNNPDYTDAIYAGFMDGEDDWSVNLIGHDLDECICIYGQGETADFDWELDSNWDFTGEGIEIKTSIVPMAETNKSHFDYASWDDKHFVIAA